TLGGKMMVALAVEKSNREKTFWLERDPKNGSVSTFYRFPLLMEDLANLSRTLYFSRYHSWMGKIREMALQPILPQIAALSETGEWGIVTNYTETTICGEAKGQDQILGKLYLTEVPSDL